MSLRRNDARRRRLVIDPTVQVGEVDEAVEGTFSAPRKRKKATQPDARNYSYGADRRNQHKTTDLIPKRGVSFLLVVLALLTCLWLINFTSFRAEQWAGRIGQSGIDALAIRGQGSLASWFSSFLLILSGLASLQIYALRRHRCDDYRGTYRLWLWLAALLIVASVNCVTNLGAVASNLIQSMFGDSNSLRDWVPLAIQLTALSVLMGRGTYEVRESRGSLALVLFVWIAYSVSAVFQLPAVHESMAGLGADAIIGNCVLFGTAALFLAHLTYGRYIFLHAHGLITQRSKKVKVIKRKKAGEPNAANKKKDVTTKSRTKNANPSVTKKSTAAMAETAGSTSPVGKQLKRARKSKPVKTTSSARDQTVNNQPVETNKSPSDVLKELAAASRAKEQTQHRPTSGSMYLEDEENENVIPMSKAQRRKQRKLDKQLRRAA